MLTVTFWFKSTIEFSRMNMIESNKIKKIREKVLLIEETMS
jgi:hypothetical protein